MEGRRVGGGGLDLCRTWLPQRSSMAPNESAEKHGMRRWAHRIRIQCVVFLVAGCFTVACSTVESPPSVPLEPIPIADFNSVAGNWEGLMVQSPPARSRYDNWVHLKIQEDGTFHFETVRTIGVFSGSGQFTLEDGSLRAKSERGSLAARLHRHVGQNDRILKAEGGSGDGITYHAELTPARRRP